MAASTPARTRKNPSGVRSPVMNSASRSSASLVISVAASASVRATSERRHAEHVGRESCGEQRADELAGRDEHLAAEMAALLLRRELILEVDACGARLDHPLHQLERVQRAAEAGLGVGDDREQVVDRVVVPSAHSIRSARSSALFSRFTIAGTLFAG